MRGLSTRKSQFSNISHSTVVHLHEIHNSLKRLSISLKKMFYANSVVVFRYHFHGRNLDSEWLTTIPCHVALAIRHHYSWTDGQTRGSQSKLKPVATFCSGRHVLYRPQVRLSASKWDHHNRCPGTHDVCTILVAEPQSIIALWGGNLILIVTVQCILLSLLRQKRRNCIKRHDYRKMTGKVAAFRNNGHQGTRQTLISTQ